jgi:hypothetical protein
MVQAARSGRQNIAEGSRASATSSQTELRLVNVARASLDALLFDYEDFLRQRKLHQWAKNSEESGAVRAAWKQDSSAKQEPEQLWALCSHWLDSANPEVVANANICLIHQANSCSIARSRGWRRSSFARAATVSNWRLAESRHATTSLVRSQRLLQARNAGNPWHCARHGPAPAPAASSGGCSGYPTCKDTRSLGGPS